MPGDTLLSTIDSPADLRRLPRAQLQQLADELRQYILRHVAQTGGHLSSSLGTVELTLALHTVFDTPHDRLVWDVGHQTYAHKILTGRRERMATLRQLGGMSGFPQRAESQYDAFGTAHSSTSISAALGMALAARQKGESRNAIAVIGDGAMTAGMAFEGLNNAGVERDARLLVVLNDNDMSISPPVGALNRHLAQLMSGQFYTAVRSVGKTMLGPVPPLLELARRLEQGAKSMVAPATVFEQFGFNYIGPINGHDLDALIPTLENIRALLACKAGPQFLHVVTQKGRGYAPAEADPVAYHGPGRFDLAAGLQAPAASAPPSFTQVFGQWVCDMAGRDPRLVAITPAMREGSGLVDFHRRFPDRYYDVGIAEQHAVTFAAGLACEGLKPVVAIYSTFLQRAYDQLIHDVAIQNLPVLFALDRAGLVGADGATHAGAFDIAFIRCIPNLSLACPADERECRQLLSTAYAQPHPVAVRYPRGAGAGVPPLSDLSELPFGMGEVRRWRSGLAGVSGASADAKDANSASGAKGIAILAFGTLLYPALAAAEKLDATVVNMRWAKPLDIDLLRAVAGQHAALVTVEEGTVLGGAGSAAAEALAALRIERSWLHLGLPDRFIDHGDPARLLAMQGLDAAGIEAAVRQRFDGLTA
ncbi:MAG: 1-deoxy-D-xylulose-5-phosphate synthase [Burkholderiaceae bacterium]|jgi:1-deoxy-D-xylulose-5-phosphate synthase|nr:1-deoxy-D-xylulose-5-phosphate synthase [Burkholderiaceae bacterium]